MKNWKKIMAGLCAAAMVSSMVVPVWAAEETTEEASDDGDVADVSEAMLGLWKDSAGDIYGFYKDNSFFGHPRRYLLTNMFQGFLELWQEALTTQERI